jgi:hypothetical protein
MGYVPTRQVFVIVQLWNVTEVINEIFSHVVVMLITMSFTYRFCLKKLITQWL